jgi:hypothetical protein
MTEHDFARIARAVHRASKMENGRTAMNNAFDELAEEIADACDRDPKFDRARFINACALPTRRT